MFLICYVMVGMWFVRLGFRECGFCGVFGLFFFNLKALSKLSFFHLLRAIVVQ